MILMMISLYLLSGCNFEMKYSLGNGHETRPTYTVPKNHNEWIYHNGNDVSGENHPFLPLRYGYKIYKVRAEFDKSSKVWIPKAYIKWKFDIMNLAKKTKTLSDKVEITYIFNDIDGDTLFSSEDYSYISRQETGEISGTLKIDLEDLELIEEHTWRITTPLKLRLNKKERVLRAAKIISNEELELDFYKSFLRTKYFSSYSSSIHKDIYNLISEDIREY